MNKLILVILLVLFSACNPEQVETKSPTTEDTIIQQPMTSAIVEPPKPREIRKWSSIETGLPRGVVDAGSQNNENQNDNYIVIKDFNNKLTIIKNLDWQIYDAIQVGDIIE